MRILMLGWEFPPHISGGLGTACYSLTQALSKLGTDILFIMPKLNEGRQIKLNNKLSLMSASGTTISSDELKNRILRASQNIWHDALEIALVDSPLTPYMTQESYEESLLNLQQANAYQEYYKENSTSVIKLSGVYGPDIINEVYRYGLAVASIALQKEFDIIHAHDWMTYPAAMLIKKLTGKPLVLHAHALEFDRSGSNRNPSVAHIEKRGMAAADAVIAVSNYTKSLIIKEYGIAESKIMVAHNAVSRKEVHKKYNIPALFSDEKRVLFMGRITFQKGPEYFVEAARLVLDHMPNVRFIMAGSGDMLTRMMHRVAHLRMGRNFHFTGFLRGEEVDRMYGLSDLYVMPSVSEPFGIAPLEAMLFDTPVLIDKQAGVSEVMPKALRVDFWDINEIANKICAVLSYPVLATEVVNNCQDEMKNIKWKNTAKIIIELYKKLSPARSAC